MKYSDLVLSYKKEYKSIGELVSNTDKVFDSKYFEGGKSDKKFNLPFVPGEIYSFSYNTDSKLSESRKFINRNPIILCVDSYKNQKYGLIVKGIDLLTVPPDNRVEILTRIYDKFAKEIESNDRTYSKGASRIPLPLNNKNLEILLSGTGYNYSIFGFKSSFMKNISVLDLEDWYKIPYLKKSSIEGLDAQGIYNEYRSKLI